jgi:hypothetical protein
MNSIMKFFGIAMHTLQAVTTAETQLSGQPGATKKEHALALAIPAAVSLAGDLLTPDKASHLTAALASAIDAFVGIANLIGHFKHATPTK